jgi:hypothetical protein
MRGIDHDGKLDFQLGREDILLSKWLQMNFGEDCGDTLLSNQK